MEAQEEEEITEEQRKRAEANRLAALSKRKSILLSDKNENPNAWKLFKCRKLSSSSSQPTNTKPVYPFVETGTSELAPTLAEKFRVRLEICSPDSFSVTPEPAPGLPYPGEEACLEKLSHWLSDVVLLHYTQNNGGGMACVYKLSEYDIVLKSLKNCQGIECEEIPWGTFNVVERFSHSYSSEKWIPCRPEHLPDEMVDELIQKLPKVLLDALMPFQLEGVRFGVRRGGRCLIADEMGLGKTLQAIAIAGCFIDDGPILIVCPAILRYSWAEELERWFPLCLPSDIHLVFRHQDNPAHLTELPRIVVISYTMLRHLQRSMLDREWATLIVDESHHLRCTKKKSEPKEIECVLDVAMKVKHLVLLSGTPSLSRPFDIFHQINMLWPGLLGKTKYEFARTYCSVKHIRICQGKRFQDFSKGARLEELNVLLKQTVMIRRLKQHVLAQLPPIRRQIIRMDLKRSDIASAKAALGVVDGDASANDEAEIDPFEAEDKKGKIKLPKEHRDQIIGLAKISGFLEWLSLHPTIAKFDCEEAAKASLSSRKMIIFGHHHKVLDKIEEYIRDKGLECIRIDANVSPTDRQEAIGKFQSLMEVKIAVMGIDSGGSGLNLTAAQDVVFLELPKEISKLDQAEGRAHRHGQRKAVNVYIFCAKNTSDESRWQKFNKSLFRVSSTVNGKYEAIREIKVDNVSYLETTGRTDDKGNEMLNGKANSEVFAGSLAISQSYCYSQDTSPLKASHESQKMAGNSNGVQKESDSISSQAQSLQAEQAIWEFGYGGSSSTATSRIAGRIFSDNLEENVNIVDEINTNDGGSFEPNEIAARGSVQVNCLRFQVACSKNLCIFFHCLAAVVNLMNATIRFSYKSCSWFHTPGIDSRPRPLYQSFKPEEMESENPLTEDVKKVANKYNEDNPDYESAVMTFNCQWKQLRPMKQKKLMGKPLQLPLSAELCYLDESLNHNKGGLLKGGSKRRSTPLHEISHPLPSNAAWRKVHLLSDCGRKERIYTQGWSAMDDEPLCKLCQNPCKNDNAKKPEFFEDLFCNLGCYEEYRLRTNNRSLREALFQVERGICTNCQLDCHKLVRHIRPLSHEKRQEYIKKVAPKLGTREKLFDKLVRNPVDGNAWHADHMVPVYLGGGECRLENMRTLCVVCHADVTAAQCAERHLTRAKAKKLLKGIMNDLKDAQTAAEVDAKLKEHQQFDTVEEEDFLVEVPGSAYSHAKAITTGSEDLH